MDPAERIANWDTKYNLTRVNDVLTAKRPTMLQHVQNVFPLITAMEQQVKQVLDGQAVPTKDYPFYLCFGRELWALTRKDISGPSAAREAGVLVEKWKGRNLSQAVLEAIRSEVFNIGAPTPP
jgi:hypothetical protein